ncbi:hypothetical protein A2U01_0033583, partial [Trifolium medium]|nr:hypothetical protein [Trifolium medium]
AVIVSLAQAGRDMLALQEYADELEETNSSLKENMADKYVDGFWFAIDQVNVLFPDIDQEILAQADVMKKIEDRKLISRIPEAK